MVETNRVENNAPVTGNVPADAGTVFVVARLPAMAMIGMIMKKRPSNWATAVLVLYHIVFALMPANADPLFPADETYAYRICESPCGPGFEMPAVPNGLTTASAEKPRIVNVRMRTASMAILTSYASIFFPRYSGVRPTISPAMNTARTTKTNIP